MRGLQSMHRVNCLPWSMNLKCLIPSLQASVPCRRASTAVGLRPASGTRSLVAATPPWQLPAAVGPPPHGQQTHPPSGSSLLPPLGMLDVTLPREALAALKVALCLAVPSKTAW